MSKSKSSSTPTSKLLVDGQEVSPGKKVKLSSLGLRVNDVVKNGARPARVKTDA